MKPQLQNLIIYLLQLTYNYYENGIMGLFCLGYVTIHIVVYANIMVICSVMFITFQPYLHGLRLYYLYWDLNKKKKQLCSVRTQNSACCAKT